MERRLENIDSGGVGRTVDVLVLAGGKSPEEMRLATGCDMRAELPFRGKRIVDHVVEAIREAVPTAEKIIVVGSNVEGCVTLPPGKTFLESIYVGLEAGDKQNVLVATADLPFLTSECVREFLDGCSLGAAINWPIVPSDLCEKQHPDMKRTTLKLREGRFTGGNLALLHREKFQKVFPNIERAYRNRKSPFKLASQIGISALFRVLFGQIFPATLSLATLERKVAGSIGEEVKAVICKKAEIGADVDTLEHYRAIIENEKVAV